MFLDSEPHDIFVSYAREDTAWVREHLYEPLQKCRTKEGRPPRIFFDVGEHGIQVGQDFLTAIEKAVEVAHRFIPVFSCTYFRKEMCMFELKLARSRDPSLKSQLLFPVLIDPEAADELPLSYKMLNYVSAADNDWFARLCHALQMTPSADELVLEFRDQPGDVFANHTLPVVRVELSSGETPISFEEEITLRADPGRLFGSTSLTTRDGVVTFDDLSIAEPLAETCLVALSPTAGEVRSRSFSVVAQQGPVADIDHRSHHAAPTIIPVSGEAIFFDTNRHLAVLQKDQVLAYGVDGSPLLKEPMPIRAPVRIVRRHQGQLVLADWKGNAYLITDEGKSCEWRLGKDSSGFTVPADIDISPEGEIFIGFWNGSVYRLDPAGSADLVLRDPAGIQATAIYEGDLFTCDFAGNLRVYRNGRITNTVKIEPVVWLLMGTPDCLIGVGEEKFYHISPQAGRIIDFEMPLGQIGAVYELSELPVVINTKGKGIRFDANLVISATVYTQPGAEPLSADNRGMYCIFRNPDGTRTLLVRDRILFSHAGGTLAVTPQGDRFALGDERAIQIFHEAEFMELVQEEETEVRHMHKA